MSQKLVCRAGNDVVEGFSRLIYRPPCKHEAGYRVREKNSDNEWMDYCHEHASLINPEFYVIEPLSEMVE